MLRSTFFLPQSVTTEALRAAIEVWAFNRRLYPGWLIAPKGVREPLYYHLHNWITEFSLLPALAPLERRFCGGDSLPQFMYF